MSGLDPDRQETEISDEELAQLLITALGEPPRDQIAARPLTTDQRLRQMYRLRRQKRRRRWVAAVSRYTIVGLVVAALIGGVWTVAGLHRPQEQTAAPAHDPVATVPVPLELGDSGSWIPARQRLTDLAGTVAELDEQPAAGRFSHTWTRLWARDATDPLAPPVVHDEQRWWAPDRAGRQTRATVTGWIPGAEPGPVPVADAGQDVSYQAGEMPVVLPELSDDVFLVSSQLAERQDPADGPQATLRAVREVYRFHAPAPRQRAAMLQALADTDRLYTAGLVDGGAGRRGLAVMADSENGTVRDIAVLDPGTGRLLAYDTVWLQPPAAVRIPTPALSDSLLIIEANHTSTPQ
ncbi:hypothetical protein [Actinoplanes couchii]|uniref:CU044_5270 family protein n=1 Tax=Actinoplanes couchii TaxID=403638 RepID=A0ABQ3XSY2_9ACTN|nr:hypothetical protein [Actinoplanes couchii]MDR6324080.1 hypothetical protein [Actinoplanes couchii]GID61606.1 hypothetical protein Aco03nite_100100 [Actinoplanes couchii]